MVRGECLRRHVLNGRLAEPDGDGHDVRVEWAQVTTIIVALATFTGMQAFWLARALDRVYSAHDRIERGSIESREWCSAITVSA